MEKKKELMYLILCVSYAILLGTTVGLMFVSIPIGQIRIPVGLLPLALTVFHIANSFRELGPEDLGTVLLFGSPIYPASSGLNFVPAIICSLRIDTRNHIQLIFGSPDTNRNQEVVALDQGGTTIVVQTPFRITGTDAKSADYGDPLVDENKDAFEARTDAERKLDQGTPLGGMLTYDPSLIARFRISNHALFLKHIGTIDNLIRQITETSESAAQTILGSRNASQIVRTLETVNAEILSVIEWMIGEPGAKKPRGFKNEEQREWWGVDVFLVSIRSLGLPRTLNESLRDAAKATAKKLETIETAKGINATLTQTGKGNANAARAMAEVFNDEELGGSAMLARQLDVIKEAIPHTKPIIVGGSIGDIADAISGKLLKTQA